jgi:hypothetical protein
VISAVGSILRAYLQAFAISSRVISQRTDDAMLLDEVGTVV